MTNKPLPPEKVKMLVAQRLRSRRKELGISAQRLSDLINVSRDTIKRYEYGENSLNVVRLYYIAIHLKVPIGYFFEDTTKPCDYDKEEIYK